MAARTCREAAMDFLARREHARLELEQKLGKRGYSSEEIEEQLDLLVKENLQSNARFAESFAQQRAENGYGDVKIHYELRQREIDDMHIHLALLPYKGRWLELAKIQRRKHFNHWPRDYDERARQSRYMQRRGYDFEIIGDLFSEKFRDSDDR